MSVATSSTVDGPGQRAIFAHFLAPGILSEGDGDQARALLRLSLLMAEDAVVVPASTYFESSTGRRVLREHREAIAAGMLRPCAGYGGPTGYQHERRRQYASDHRRGQRYFAAADPRDDQLLSDHWQEKRCRTTPTIGAAWIKSTEEFGRRLQGSDPQLAANKGQRALAAVPSDLEDNAFIPDFALKRVSRRVGALSPVARTVLTRAINSAFVGSYFAEFGSVAAMGAYFGVDALLPRDTTRLSRQRLQGNLDAMGLSRWIETAQADELVQARESVGWRALRSILFADATGLFDITSLLIKAKANLRLTHHASFADRIEQWADLLVRQITFESMGAISMPVNSFINFGSVSGTVIQHGGADSLREWLTTAVETGDIPQDLSPLSRPLKTSELASMVDEAAPGNRRARLIRVIAAGSQQLATTVGGAALLKLLGLSP